MNGLQTVSQVNEVTSSYVSLQSGSLTRLLFKVVEATGAIREGFSRQEYWSGLTFPSPGDLPNPGIEPGSPALQEDALPSEPPICLTSHVYSLGGIQTSQVPIPSAEENQISPCPSQFLLEIL